MSTCRTTRCTAWASVPRAPTRAHRRRATTTASSTGSTCTVVGRVSTGVNPRSMAISPDGRALYVVNYGSDTMTKLRADDLTPLQTIATLHHPIGITYDRDTASVWVACYVGRILVFDD